MENLTTPFSQVYKSFLSKITEDMYLELTLSETYSLLQELLISSIYKFEFPRNNLTDYVCGDYDENEFYSDEEYIENCGHFNCLLTGEEINILATYMVVEWLNQQIASVELTRMKYSSNDFKMTSQANHLKILLTTQKRFDDTGKRLQRLYKRRKLENGKYVSTFGEILDEG